MRGKKRVIKVGNVPVKSREQIEGIRESGKINTMVLDFCGRTYQSRYFHPGD